MAIKHLAGERLIGTAAERAALSGSNLTAIPQTSWKELGRYTLTGTEDTINVGLGTQSGTSGVATGSFAAKDNLMIIAHLIPTGDIEARLQFNGDGSSGNENYSSRYSYNGASDVTTDVDADSTKFGHYANPSGEFIVSKIRNTLNEEKLCTTHSVFHQGTNLYREESVAKWEGTDQIVNVQVPNIQSGSYLSGSSVIVLGCDDDEADSGTNFWQEQTNKVTTETGSTFTTDSFTGRKYLMFEMYADTEAGDMSPLLKFNGSGSGYKTKHSQNGGGDSAAFTTSWACGYSADQHAHIYINGFIINPSDQQKFGIYNVVSDLLAGQNAIKRWEYNGVWTNTSAAITTMTFEEGSSNTFGAGSFIRVWGSD